MNFNQKPEQCGFGFRQIVLNAELNRLEFVQLNKQGYDSIIKISDIKQVIIPQITSDIIKIQRGNKKQNSSFESEITNTDSFPERKLLTPKKLFYSNTAKQLNSPTIAVSSGLICKTDENFKENALKVSKYVFKIAT